MEYAGQAMIGDNLLLGLCIIKLQNDLLFDGSSTFKIKVNGSVCLEPYVGALVSHGGNDTFLVRTCRMP